MRSVRIVSTQDWQLKAEVQAPDGTYLAGFRDVVSARAYCAMMGYRVVP